MEYAVNSNNQLDYKVDRLTKITTSESIRMTLNDMQYCLTICLV
jgi:hypothetical protein